MSKYKILVQKHSLKNNKIGVFGQLVEESQLTTKPEILIKAGFIELEVEEKEDDSFDLAKMSKAELIEFCKNNEIEIESNLNKSQILDAIEENAKNIEVKE